MYRFLGENKSFLCDAVLCLVTLSRLTLCNTMHYSPPGSSVHGDSPGKNIGEGCHALLQGIFTTQGTNPGLSHCRQILQRLSHQRSPRILEWVTHPFSRGSSLIVLSFKIYFRARWVFIAVPGFYLFAGAFIYEPGATLQFQCEGFSLRWPLVLWSTGSTESASFSNCGTQAQLPRHMWDLPRPGIQLTSSALEGRFLTTGPPGKSPYYPFVVCRVYGQIYCFKFLILVVCVFSHFSLSSILVEVCKFY